MPKSFDKYYKKDEFGHYNPENLRQDILNRAIKFWKLKGHSKKVVAEKYFELNKKIDSWSFKQRIAVGNTYCNLINKLVAKV